MPTESTHGRALPDHDSPHGDVGTMSPAAPVAYVVRQLADVVDRLTDDQYTRHPVGPFQSPIGSQVRHCLDHVQAYLRGIETGTMDYDHRDRGTPVETDRAVAVRLTHELADGLLALDPSVFDRPVRLTVMLSKDDRGNAFESTASSSPRSVKSTETVPRWTGTPAITCR